MGTAALKLWNVLGDAYTRLGFDVLGDEAFRAMAPARAIKPTSKAETFRDLDEIGSPLGLVPNFGCVVLHTGQTYVIDGGRTA